MTSFCRLVSLSLFLTSSLAFAQSSFTVNAPFDPAHYVPLTGKQRWQRWLKEDGASPAIHIQSFTAATYLQVIDDPPVWDRTGGGYIRRVGSSYGNNLIENTVHESLASAAGTDPRYYRCACTGFFHRSGHALEMTFLTYNHDGHKTLDFPQLAGVYTGAMVSTSWWPHHDSMRVQGVQTGHVEVGLEGATHLVQEFSPELKRIFHLHTNPKSAKP